MFMPIKFNTTIILVPSEMTEGFDSIVYNKVRSTLENCCSKHGYIKKDSIKISQLLIYKEYFSKQYNIFSRPYSYE